MLSAIANAAKFTQICQKLPKTAQNYPKLPKSAQRQLVQKTLKFHQKLRFWFRGDIRACAHHLDFHYKNLPYAFFNVNKRPLYEFQHTHLCKMMFFPQLHTSSGYEILFTYT
jgi:hypothetical protein